MIRKNTIIRASLVAALTVSAQAGFAQDVHFTQFDASPLIVNPAFTGAFNGQYRASAIYRDQWRSVTVPFKTVAASFDMPVIQDLSIDDYLAAGLQFYSDKAGDGNLSNTSVLASVAYHKFLGSGAFGANKVISVGLQGGYTQKSIDLSKLYFGDEFRDGMFQQGTTSEQIDNKISYFTVNAGISYSQAISQNFGISLGVGANNLNQPQESMQRKKNSEVGLGIRYTGQAGAIWQTSERFSIRPGVLYQTQSTAAEIVGGSEFNYKVGNPDYQMNTTAVFLGGWYRSSDAVMATAGIEFRGFRLGVSYDYNISDLNDASNGNGGFEISLRYIAPNPLDWARRLIYPCARF